MATYFEFSTSNGQKVIIETTSSAPTLAVTDPTLAGKVSGIGDAVNRINSGAQELFEKALAATTSAHARAFAAGLQELSDPPSEASLEFGIKISAELGNVIVSKIAGESSYTIKLTWKSATGPNEDHGSS
jgi:hypothetical protein